MKAARAGHLCTVQFLISKGAPLTNITFTYKLNVSCKDNILLAYWASTTCNDCESMWCIDLMCFFPLLLSRC